MELTARFNIFQLNTCQLCDVFLINVKQKLIVVFILITISKGTEENPMTGVIEEIDFSAKVRPDLLWH